MAGGLNKAFLRDPDTFLHTHMYTVKDQDMDTGVHKVTFVTDPGGRVMLQKFVGQPGKYQHPFDCHFLRAMPNARNLGAMLDAGRAHWFFTSTVTGCQVMAHGAPQTPYIEHNNCLNSQSATADYDRMYQDIADSNPLFRVHNGDAYQVNGDLQDMGNVIGRYLPSGRWEFLFQKKSNGVISVTTVY